MVEIDHEHDGLLVDLAAAHVTASLKAAGVDGRSQQTGREARSLPLGLFASPTPSTLELPVDGRALRREIFHLRRGMMELELLGMHNSRDKGRDEGDGRDLFSSEILNGLRCYDALLRLYREDREHPVS